MMVGQDFKLKLSHFFFSQLSGSIFCYLTFDSSNIFAERTVEEMNSEFIEFEDLIWDGQKGSKWGVIDNIHMTTPAEIF